jgi:outer membrane protein assembly factor BamD
MEFLTIRAQYLYAKNSLEIKQEERYNAAITFYEQFAERYPNSKFMKEAQNLKKDCEQGIQQTKRILAEAETNQKLARKIEAEKKSQPKLEKDTTAIKN